MGIGAYHGVRKVVRKLMACLKVHEVCWLVGDSSPELVLRRSSPVVHGPVTLVRKRKKRGVRDVRTGPLGRKREMGEGEVDGAHRGLPRTAADT